MTRPAFPHSTHSMVIVAALDLGLGWEDVAVKLRLAPTPAFRAEYFRVARLLGMTRSRPPD